jgi:alkaline phosphatase
MKKKVLPGNVICIFLLLVFMSFTVYANEQGEKVKYIFLFIGDGMGIPQVALAEGYLGYQAGEKSITLCFSQFPCQGITKSEGDTMVEFLNGIEVLPGR